jgi:hypothetical protein
MGFAGHGAFLRSPGEIKLEEVVAAVVAGH